jgi:hypothetical protein
MVAQASSPQPGVPGGAAPFTAQFERLRGHTPPPAPAPELGRVPGRRDEHCLTRSELLAMRKQTYIDANEERKLAHEEANPIWAATISVPPSECKPSFNRTQTRMRAERRQDRVATSVLSCGDGILERDKNIMLDADPTALVTTIARPTYGPELPIAYVEQPEHSTRSHLMHGRKQELIAANGQTMKAIGRGGYRSFYQRVGDRLDSSLKSYYDSQENASANITRNKLLEARKADFIAENDRFVQRHHANDLAQPTYDAQPEPFWTLGQQVAQPAIASRNDLLESYQWYRKPEVFVPGRSPREADPFKAGDATRLSDKLSSGPRRFQRGYPAERRQVTGMIQQMEPPDASVYTKPSERRASIKQTLRYLDFKLAAEHQSESFSGTDMAMEAPMYSSFSRDGIFREPPRVSRPRSMMARRESADTIEQATLGFSGALGGASSPMLMSTRLPAKPGTATSVRSGGFQVIDTLTSLA